MEYYIYTLSDPISLDIRYIGKTKNLKDRLQRHMSPYNLKQTWNPKNKWLKNLKNNNLKPIIELLDIGNENTIDNLEVYWISQFNTWGFNLKNVAKGGQNPNPKGERLKKEHIDSLKNSNKNKIPVIQYTLNNEVVCEYESIKDAILKTGLYHISCCCRGVRHKTGDYYFRYKDKYFPYVEKVNHWIDKKHTEESKLKMKMNHPMRKIICQYDKNNNLIDEFLSSYEAQEKTSIQRSHIMKCCRGVKNYNSAGGYIWKYKS